MAQLKVRYNDGKEAEMVDLKSPDWTLYLRRPPNTSFTAFLDGLPVGSVIQARRSPNSRAYTINIDHYAATKKTRRPDRPASRNHRKTPKRSGTPPALPGRDSAVIAPLPALAAYLL
jgi:hypothetical protein